MTKKGTIKAEIFRGPFDPGGQPESRTGNPLEVSLFAWNVQGGQTASMAVLEDPPRYRDFWHWPSASKLLREADRLGFDHQLQYGLWSGYGGASGWNDAALDFATGAAAAAAVTERLGLISTVHVGYRFHPLHIAKIGASIDFISNGRWGMNIVAGQNPTDFRKFGYQERPGGPEKYALPDEFTTLLKYLWSSDAPVDFEGEYFQAYGASVAPLPVSKPRPVLLNAGRSEAGFDFACRHADIMFISPADGRVESYGASVEKAHKLASKYGRTIRIAAMCFFVVEGTDADAHRIVEHLEEHVDREAVGNWLSGVVGPFSDEARQDPYFGVGREMFMRVGVGMGGHQIFGSYETAAEKMRALHDVGVEIVAAGVWDPLSGVTKLGEQVFPILKKMNLRK